MAKERWFIEFSGEVVGLTEDNIDYVIVSGVPPTYVSVRAGDRVFATEISKLSGPEKEFLLKHYRAK
ncbi:MAG TPA: hypothetical protein VFA43_21410 [Gemmatimonadaceae bacterium]|nr:hypothetical protein [Gemmatimonadaceae bacterium]